MNREEKRVSRISSVVLSSQRVDLKDAIYNAVKDKDKAEIANPLGGGWYEADSERDARVQQGARMYIYLQAYQPKATTAQPLVAFVTFYRGQTKVFETAPLPVLEGLNNKLKTMPMKFSLSHREAASGANTIAR